MKVTQAEITPEYAATMLQTNTHNRAVRVGLVNRYARTMRDGRWIENGETIKVDTDGRLLDGQHRLLACLQAGVSFPGLIVDGLDPSAFATIDTGRARSNKDILQLAGYGGGANLAAAINWHRVLIAGRLSLKRRNFADCNATAPEALSLLRERPQLIAWTQRAAAAQPLGRWVSPGLIGALFTVFADTLPTTAEALFAEVNKPADDLPQTAPARALHDALKMRYGTPHGRGDDSPVVAAWFIHGWNAYCDDADMPQRPTPSTDEAFPRIAGLDEARPQRSRPKAVA